MSHFFRSILDATGLMNVPLLAVVALAASAHPLAAQDLGDPLAGHQIAQTWCSNCHVVGPDEQRGTSTGAPTFSAIAAMKTTTSLGLAAFLQTPHQRMPDLHLSRDEIDDVSAYIISLRKAPAR